MVLCPGIASSGEWLCNLVIAVKGEFVALVGELARLAARELDACIGFEHMLDVPHSSDSAVDVRLDEELPSKAKGIHVRTNGGIESDLGVVNSRGEVEVVNSL